MKIPLLRIAAAIFVAVAFSSCSTLFSEQQNHQFKSGYVASPRSVVVATWFGKDKFNLNGPLASELISRRLSSCGYQTKEVPREFYYPTLKKGKRFISEKADRGVLDGKEHQADSVFMIIEIERNIVTNIFTSNYGQTVERYSGELYRAFRVQYYDTRLQEVVWSSDIIMNAILNFSSDEKSQNLSDAIFLHMSKDRVFADCVPEAAEKT